MKVFLSWSGNTSLKVAEALDEWIPTVIQSIEPYLSTEVDKGRNWRNVLSDRLDDSSCGIICVTSDNESSRWLNFEAGALSKSVDRGKVMPFLFHVKDADINGPLSDFQSTVSYERKDVKKLLQTLLKACIKHSSCNKRFTVETMNQLFDEQWPKLENKLNKIKIDIYEKNIIAKQQSHLRSTLETTSSLLRKNNASPPEIRKAVTSIVKLWSQAVYKGRDIPPEPTEVIFFEGTLMCQLCNEAHQPTKKMCCRKCGLFCDKWIVRET